MVLLFVILVTFSYAILYYFFNLTNPDNSINKNYRKYIIPNYFLRNIFRFHQAGDARLDFATEKNFKKLIVIAYYQEEEILYPETIELAVSEIKNIVKKSEITIKKVPLLMSFSDAVSDDDLRTISKKYPAKWPIFNETAILQIFILRKYAPFPTFAGLVKDDHNIFIFMDSIRGVSDQQSSTQNAEVSTILHEFGHLLGAEHVNDDSCIMSGKVENIIDGFPTIISNTYCSLDYEEIEKALSI